MNTLKYTQLVDFKGDDYTSKATKNSEEARQLIENGFEYVRTTPDEIVLFRKRKWPLEEIHQLAGECESGPGEIWTRPTVEMSLATPPFFLRAHNFFDYILDESKQD